MVTITPYLSVSSAVEALELYQKIFGAELIERSSVSEDQIETMGLPKDADLSKTTIHCSFKVGDAILFMSDNFSGDVLGKTNVSILISPDSLEQAESIFTQAAENDCEVTMLFEKQFWGDYFGSFKDPFGISWQVNLSPEE